MKTRSGYRIVLILLASSAFARAGEPPPPERHLGFQPGADGRLADWRSVVEYFQAADQASDRVAVFELGKTTEGRPFLMAAVSHPETVARLERYRDWQKRLADPRRFQESGQEREAIESSKPVVMITCSIHSDETASTLMAVELLHQLAGRDDPATREILDGTVLLLVPSVNPDGIDKVKSWYDRSRGTAWEGSGMTELYHRYAGHDTNRDWFMLNLQETRLLTRVLYREWFPTLLYDVHQMGSRGARMFVPPFHDPINPNIDPRIHQSIAVIGSHMAASLAAEGKRGVLTSAIYDNWWNGGNRTTPQRHNIVSVLTEAASVKLATPVFVGSTELSEAGRGFADHRAATNFVDPWPGGWWRLRDIVDYELTCARALLTLAARYRREFQTGLAAMARTAIARGKSESPAAWLVPRDLPDPGTAARMVGILHDSGIEVREACDSFQAGGRDYQAGTWILPADQPYRAHLKDLMERQDYTPRFNAAGAAEAPYDVTGWTLPLLMGVRTVPVVNPLAVSHRTLDTIERPRGSITEPASGQPGSLILLNQSNDDFVLINALLREGIPVTPVRGCEVEQLRVKGGSYAIPDDPGTRERLAPILKTVSSRLAAIPGTAKPLGEPLRRVRLGVYQPWVPSMDEGWTRYVLEQFQFPYVTVHNEEIRAGELGRRFDTLVIPSIEAKILRRGYAPGETEPRYVGGLGVEGAAALRDFVAEGGTLICLENSCSYVIEELSLPVTNLLQGLSRSRFFGPGSIVEIKVDSAHPIAWGMPERCMASFDRSLAFEVGKAEQGGYQPHVIARYADSKPLASGWMLGPEIIQGKAALVELARGKGRVVLFGFPPQNRGQTHGTFRLLFNALLAGGT